MEEISKHFYVSGRVQGVWYRASAHKKATELNLKGWVRNLPDGRVESVAVGEDDLVNAFERWLWEGPQFAKVERVATKEIEVEEFFEFEVRY